MKRIMCYVLLLFSKSSLDCERMCLVCVTYFFMGSYIKDPIHPLSTIFHMQTEFIFSFPFIFLKNCCNNNESADILLWAVSSGDSQMEMLFSYILQPCFQGRTSY